MHGPLNVKFRIYPYRRKTLSIMGQYTSYLQASDMQTTVLYTLYSKTQAFKYFKLRKRVTPCTTVLL